ncbi:MAG: hypothetical protein ABSD57_08365 [Verrucomicrobiota bacterium]|jgi:hypothetical protein
MKPAGWLFGLITTISLMLAGCVMPVGSGSHGRLSTEVTVFHDLPTNLVGTTFMVILSDTNLVGSLEYESYLKLVQTELESKQLRSVDIADNPDWLVFLHFRTYPPQKFSRSTPVFGQTGGGYTLNQGTVWSGSGPMTYSGSSYTAPQSGVVGYRNSEHYAFGWGLRIEFYDGAAYRADSMVQRYDAKSIAVGDGGSLSEVVPVLVHEIFRDFPGKSGVERDRNVRY